MDYAGIFAWSREISSIHAFRQPGRYRPVPSVSYILHLAQRRLAAVQRYSDSRAVAYRYGFPGAVLIPGAKAPHLITRDMLSTMEKGSVLVDVAIDQGGCFETSRPTTHSEPVYEVDGIIHYCVANIPGAVSATSTLALTNATLPYVVQLANKGWQKACSEDEALYKGLNIVDGKIIYPAVAEAFGLPCETI